MPIWKVETLYRSIDIANKAIVRAPTKYEALLIFPGTDEDAPPTISCEELDPEGKSEVLCYHFESPT